MHLTIGTAQFGFKYGLDKIKIMSGGPKVELGALDIQVLDTPLKLNTSPQLTGVEILE